MTDLSVKMAGVSFKNPVITASGTCGFGREYEAFYPLSALGGISVKGMTLHKKAGNPPPRIAEIPSGMINSVGLQNPGIDAFIENELPNLSKKGTTILANVAGGSIEDCVEMSKKLNDTCVDMIELNISCPNVKAGGAAFGSTPCMAEAVTKAVRAITAKPLMVKLSPNVTDITEIAKAVESAGADAVSLINSILAMRIDIRTRRPILHNNVGGMSGSAVFPIALRMVWQTANAVHIPVCGIGGITKWEDAVEMMMAGASCIQVGAASFQDPMAPIKILNGMENWANENHIEHISDITKSVIPY